MSFNLSLNDGVADLNIKSFTRKSSLLLAFENSDETLVVELIEQGANLNCHDVENITPLHHAAYRGWLSVVDLLLQKGADPDVTTSWGSTALLIACARENKEIAKLLSKYSKSLDCVTEECNSKIFDLACCTDEDDCNWTALHFASSYGWQEMVKLLVQRGANINAQNSKGKTPLLVAFAYRQGNIAQLLIDLGADLNCCGKNKWTILHYAAAHNWLCLVESVVKKGAEFDAKTAKGLTPLLLAAERGKRHVVYFLIAETGSAIECYNSEKHTVLWFALDNGWLEVLERLADKGVDFDKEMPSGDIPILVAMAAVNNSWKKKIVHFLIELDVDLKHCDQKGWTVLHYASRDKWPDVARAAIEGGCDVNTVNWSGNTPLHIVCDFTESPNTELTRESVQLVELLIEKGADVDVKNSHGETPVYLASKYLEYPGIGSRGLIIFNCLLNAQCRGLV